MGIHYCAKMEVAPLRVSAKHGKLYSNASFHRIPKDPTLRTMWISVLQIREDIKPSTRVCCRHFPGGNTNETPDITLGSCICTD